VRNIKEQNERGIIMNYDPLKKFCTFETYNATDTFDPYDPNNPLAFLTFDDDMGTVEDYDFYNDCDMESYYNDDIDMWEE
jgi:hypothetical protein